MPDERESCTLAGDLLAGGPRYRKEDNVRRDLDRLLVALGVERTDIEGDYSVPEGAIDLYLPRHRLVIETKATGKAAAPDEVQAGRQESARGQLERYVQAVIADQLQLLPVGKDLAPERRWTGIVTDGRYWHVYDYPHAETPLAGRRTLHTGPWETGAEALATRLRDLLGSEPVGRTWIPADPAALFRESLEQLVALYGDLEGQPLRDMRTKQALWHDMLRVSGMSPPGRVAPDRLFATHTLLIVIARMVVHALTAAGGPPTAALQDGFASWVLGWPQGEQWTESLWHIVRRHDWRPRRGDVLRSLYESFVPAADRQVFGEFYTPDWLAAMIVEQALDAQWLQAAIRQAETALEDRQPLRGVGVLDPACGSGTFLYHAARRILAAPAMNGLTPVQKANVTALLLNGLDVHPVAVEISKANLMRVLPAQPTEGESALRVYLGDALLARKEDMPLFDGPLMRIATPQGRSVDIPTELVRQDTFGDSIRRLVRAASREEAVPDTVLGRVSEAARSDLRQCLHDLTAVIGREGNSVWAWYAMNVASPHLLALRKVNRIVANPPWVQLASIQEPERKRLMEQLGNRLQLQAGGHQSPHLDIATFFVRRARELYLADPQRDPAIWLVKKSSLRAGHWRKFREQHRSLAQTVDLEPLQPFGGGDARRCCLLLEISPLRFKGLKGKARAPRQSTPTRNMVARMMLPRAAPGQRQRPRAEDSWSTVRNRIGFEPAPEPLPQASSDYQGTFRQGASIVPHVLLLVDAAFPQGERVRVRTRPSRQPRWNALEPRHVEIPQHWLSTLYLSKNLRPFLAATGTTQAIIPKDPQGNLTLSSALDEAAWEVLDEAWRTHRSRGQRTPRTLAERVDFNGGLSAQSDALASDRYRVLYPASGDIMRAARVPAGNGVVDFSLYWLLAESPDEAGYLTALLNAPCLSRAFAASRESGRDFHLHPFRKVPVPRYDSRNTQHAELARLCREAETVAEQMLQDRQRASSRAVRSRLLDSGILARIDTLVADLLPDQSVPEPALAGPAR